VNESHPTPGRGCAPPEGEVLHAATTAWRWHTRPAVAAGGLLLVSALIYGEPGRGRLTLLCALSALLLLGFSLLPRRRRPVTLTRAGLAVEGPHGTARFATAELEAVTLEGGPRVVTAAGTEVLVGPDCARRFPHAAILPARDLEAIWDLVRRADATPGGPAPACRADTRDRPTPSA
jgi:hypothetical protein